MNFFLDIYLRSKRSPCANFRIEKRKLLPSSVGDGYGTQLTNRTETVLLEYGVLELSYGISYVFFSFFICKSPDLYMFIDCTSNSEDHFEITSAAVHSSLTLSQPIT